MPLRPYGTKTLQCSLQAHAACSNSDEEDVPIARLNLAVSSQAGPVRQSAAPLDLGRERQIQEVDSGSEGGKDGLSSAGDDDGDDRSDSSGGNNDGNDSDHSHSSAGSDAPDIPTCALSVHLSGWHEPEHSLSYQYM